MAYCKKLLVLFLILFILLFNFSSVFASESVELSQVNGITISPSSNAFTSSSEGNVKYFYAEVGYKYIISLTSGSSTRLVASTSGVPALNLPYEIIASLNPSDTFTYIPSENVYVGLGTSTKWEVQREEISGINNTIGNLVENVGPNAFWGVFGNGLDFVFIVVTVAFGIFIIVKLIKGLSKGKSKI